MTDEGYKNGTTAGSRWGCATAAIIGVPLFLLLMIVDALGDCAPDTDCKKGFLPFVLAPTVFVAVALFVIVRMIVNQFSRSSDGR